MPKLSFVTGIVAACLFAGSANAITLINEYRPNPTGGDPATQEVELLGTPGESFSGVISAIDTDAGGPFGLINDFNSVAGTFDVNGLAVVSIDDLENPSHVIIFSTIAPAIGTDLDVDDDGSIDDLSVFGTVFDAIGVIDTAGDSNGIAAQLGGTEIVFTGDEPQLVFRDALTQILFAVNDPADPDFVDDEAGNEVSISDFSFDPTVATFGSANPTAVPLPAGLPLLLAGLGGLAFLRRRA
ncbi:MAG: VPLPA-CTERM sorting domain-containing protein [Pseudomonadota bacterium]